jgi:hypothetical protein
MKVVWLCCALLFFGVVNCPEGRCQNEPRGTLYVQPNSPEPPTRVSPGQFYNPATLTMKIDKRPAILCRTKIVIAVAVEASHQDVLPGSFELSVDTAVIGAAVHLDG